MMGMKTPLISEQPTKCRLSITFTRHRVFFHAVLKQQEILKNHVHLTK